MPRRRTERPAETTEDIAMRSYRYTKDQVDEVLHQTEEYVRENPGQSMLYAFVAGYVLNWIPIGRILSTIFRLLLVALKPAALIYGATRAYQALQDEQR
jgi:hypothetical protein